MTTKDFLKSLSRDQGRTGRSVEDKEQPVFGWGGPAAGLGVRPGRASGPAPPASSQHCLLGARSVVTTNPRGSPTLRLTATGEGGAPLGPSKVLAGAASDRTSLTARARLSHPPAPTAGLWRTDSPGPGLPFGKGSGSSVAFPEATLQGTISEGDEAAWVRAWDSGWLLGHVNWGEEQAGGGV